MIRLSSAQTFKVVTYIMSHPRTSQVEVAKETGASRNLVNHVVSKLVAPGILAQRGKLDLRLEDPLRLLETMSVQRPLSSLIVKEVRTEESEVSRVEKLIREVAGAKGYALTCFSALSKRTSYYITYPTVHVYSRKPAELSDGLAPGRGDVTVQILKPDSETILDNAGRSRGFTVVEPVQVVIDLFCLGGPGRDGAMKLYKEITKA
jgi:DNA-binding Lrp family transcriptional regulator